METFYLIDFENVHDEGIKNIPFLTGTEHVHIFSTKNAKKKQKDIVFPKEKIDINVHMVPVGNQSLDMHLVSYLGYLLGIHGKQCTYVIISKDTDYDNIIKFWKEAGYSNISRKQKIPGTLTNQKKTVQPAKVATPQTANSTISVRRACDFSVINKSELTVFMYRELRAMGYSSNDENKIRCYVIHKCNDDGMLDGIKDPKTRRDVETILKKFVSYMSTPSKRESQVRYLLDKDLYYFDNKEKIIEIIISAKTKQQINNNLMKLYADGNAVKHIYQTIKPLINDLPGK